MPDTVLVLLAGGKSNRMGSAKGLLGYNGTYWILEQISRFKNTGNPKVYIGLGFDFEKYFKAIPWFKEALDNFYLFNGVEVKVVINKQPDLGAFSTLQTVLKVVDSKYSALVLPIDVPLVNKQTLQSILQEENIIVIPKFENKNGHPVKLKSQFWNQLLNIDLFSNEARLDHQIKKVSNSSITYANVLDSSINQNINTKQKWNDYIKKAPRI